MTLEPPPKPDMEAFIAPLVVRFYPWLRRLMILFLIWLVFACGLWTFTYFYGQNDQTQPADAIIVLGSGLRNNRPGPGLTRRSEHAAEMWKRGFAPYVICSGGVTGDATRSEADACGEVLRENGVPPEAIILEEKSRSTEENAIYTHEIFTERGWSTGIIVSDSYHMLRAQWIFQMEGMTVFNSPVLTDKLSFGNYLSSSLREIGAFHWLVFKKVFNLPQTYVGGL